MSQQKTGLMYSDAFASYKASDGYLCLSADSNPWISTTDYYDTPERVTEAYELLAKSGLLSKLTPIAPRSATKEELTSFHSVEYIEKLRMLSEGSGGEAGEFCQIGPDGLKVISEAVGGDLAALDAVMEKRVNNAFCLQRPPGGHAERESGFGFCVVNNFNILINRAREKYGLKRVMIIDFDNHYKNGIEEAWYGTDEVLYAEIHRQVPLPKTAVRIGTQTILGKGRDVATTSLFPCPLELWTPPI